MTYQKKGVLWDCYSPLALSAHLAEIATFSLQQKHNSDSDIIDQITRAHINEGVEKEQIIHSYLHERRSLEKGAIEKLEEIIARCRAFVNQFPSSVPIDDLQFQIEREIITSEKDILREKLTSFNDRLSLQKNLWHIREQHRSILYTHREEK